jgi:hypothetical protein
MKVKTSDLIGPALDWAVAQCEGFPTRNHDENYIMADVGGMWDYFSPSTDWAQGGPIIERELIRTIPWMEGTNVDSAKCWWAGKYIASGDSFGFTGPTPLIAAMRCYVISKLGDTVDIPEELTK